jgi:TolA-binding protein
MSPRTAAARAEAEVETRRHGVFGALAAALPDRTTRRAEAERPALEVVAPAARRRRSWQVGTVAGALLFLAMFVIVGAQTLIVQQQRHIDQVNGRITAAQDQAEQLKMDLAELQSPERIVNEARDRLGMVQAPSPVYLLPGTDDDTRAAEVPAATPTTTVPKATAPTTTAKSGATSKATTPTTAAKSGTTSKSTTPTTTAKTTTPTTAAKATTGTGTGR